jgi:hypothetical protein
MDGLLRRFPPLATLRRRAGRRALPDAMMAFRPTRPGNTFYRKFLFY